MAIGPVQKACKECSFVSGDDVCPRCGGQTSREWQGYLIVVDFEKSDIAKKMGITANGKYALRVR
jgi:DNA-directed RNA polymerase subunit E"